MDAFPRITLSQSVTTQLSETVLDAGTGAVSVVSTESLNTLNQRVASTCQLQTSNRSGSFQQQRHLSQLGHTLV